VNIHRDASLCAYRRYQLCVIHPSSFFIGSLCIHFLLLPSFVSFHPLTAFCFRALDSVTRWTFRLASIFALLLFIAVISVILTTPSYLETFRFNELLSLPADWSNASAFTSDTGVCVMQYHGLSIVNALGLALGGYDVHRNSSVFHRQLEYFFGPDWEQTISYTAEDLGTNMTFLIYNVFGLTVFAFRGFATVPELGLQLEMLIRYRAVPLLLDLMSGYEMITNQFFALYSDAIDWFRSFWFSPQSVFDQFLNKAEKIHAVHDLEPDSRVLFVGINTDGAVAKGLALMTGHRGIAFLSLPIATEFLDNLLQSDDPHLPSITNVFNLEGAFGVEDDEVTDNFAIPGDSKLMMIDNVYQSFCNLAEYCGYHQQFSQYCETAIGVDELNPIRDYLKLSGTS
jgi:hypothetical protein